MNDKFLGNTSFFGNSYRIEGLLPGVYTIRVQKNDYSTWQKSANVDEGFVNEFSKILLLPKDEKEFEELNKEIALIFPPSAMTPRLAASTASASEPFVLKRGVLSIVSEASEKIADNVKGFVLSKDKNKLAWWTANEVWVMWLNDANYQPYRKKGDKELITRFSIQIKKVAWFRDDDHLILDTGYFNILEIDTRGGINIVTL